MDPEQAGVPITLTKGARIGNRVKFSLQNVSLYDVIRYLCFQTGLKFRIIEGHRIIVIGPEAEIAKFDIPDQRATGANRLVRMTRARSTKDIEAKLKKITVKRMDYEDQTLQDVVNDVCRKSKEFDPDKSGVNILLFSNGRKRNMIDYLKVADINLNRAILLICEAGGVKYRVEPSAILLFDDESALDECEMTAVSPGRTAQSAPGEKKTKMRRRKKQ